MKDINHNFDDFLGHISIGFNKKDDSLSLRALCPSVPAGIFQLALLSSYLFFTLFSPLCFPILSRWSRLFHLLFSSFSCSTSSFHPIVLESLHVWGVSSYLSYQPFLFLVPVSFILLVHLLYKHPFLSPSLSSTLSSNLTTFYFVFSFTLFFYLFLLSSGPCLQCSTACTAVACTNFVRFSHHGHLYWS